MSRSLEVRNSTLHAYNIRITTENGDVESLVTKKSGFESNGRDVTTFIKLPSLLGDGAVTCTVSVFSSRQNPASPLSAKSKADLETTITELVERTLSLSTELKVLEVNPEDEDAFPTFSRRLVAKLDQRTSASLEDIARLLPTPTKK